MGTDKWSTYDELLAKCSTQGWGVENIDSPQRPVQQLALIKLWKHAFRLSISIEPF